jgi:hypothetical protein
MQKVEGVQSARVGLKQGLTVLELKPDNKVTLVQLRTVIRNNGFVSREVQITARGTQRDGVFAVSGTAERLKITGQAKAGENGQWQFTSPTP